MDELSYEGGFTIDGAEGEPNGHIVLSSKLGDIDVQMLVTTSNMSTSTRTTLTALECRELAGALRLAADAADRYRDKTWSARDDVLARLARLGVGL
jgi:hypothetical protein